MPTVLVTGFDPFGGEAVNASWQAVRRLAGETCGDARWPSAPATLHVAELPTSFEGAPRELARLVSELDPDVVIAVGQGGDSPLLAIESRFVNRIDARIVDNAGAMPRGVPVVDRGPASIRPTWSTGDVVSALAIAGHPAGISSSAGRFVCNALGYELARIARIPQAARTARTGRVPPRVTGFVHVPRFRLDEDHEARSETTAAALRVVVRAALGTWLESEAAARGA